MKTPAPSGRTQPLWFVDNLVHVHVDGDTSGGALALLDERGRRGNMPPLHVHRRDDETFGLDLAPLIAQKAHELLRRAGILRNPS
jgi:hypothetical protein